MKKIIKKILKNSALQNLSLSQLLLKTGLVSRSEYYNILTELVMKKVLKDTSVCVDVGCHQGDILQMMLKYAPRGKMFAFEPLPDLFKYLNSHFSSNPNITFSDIALSDTRGESRFNYVITNPGYSGFKRRKYDRPEEEDTTITVTTDLMDNVLGDAAVDFIKIDVEGAELQVLRGGKESIKKNKPYIVFEHGLGAADCYNTRPEDVFDLLNGYCGLKLTLMDRYLMHKEPLSKSEFCDQFYQGKNYYFLAYSP